jgi:hypothetical protein
LSRFFSGTLGLSETHRRGLPTQGSACFASPQVCTTTKHIASGFRQRRSPAFLMSRRLFLDCKTNQKPAFRATARCTCDDCRGRGSSGMQEADQNERVFQSDEPKASVTEADDPEMYKARPQTDEARGRMRSSKCVLFRRFHAGPSLARWANATAATATAAVTPNRPAWRQNQLPSFLTVAPMNIRSCLSLPGEYGGYLRRGSGGERQRVCVQAKAGCESLLT